MGFTEILTIIFVLLKVFGVISWSWWLVFLPEIIVVVFYIIVVIASVIGMKKEFLRRINTMYVNPFWLE